MGVSVKRLADDLLRRSDGEVCKLLPELGDSGVAFHLDLAAGALQHRLLLDLRLLTRLFLETLPHGLRLGDNLLALATRRFDFRLSVATSIDRLLLAALRRA